MLYMGSNHVIHRVHPERDSHSNCKRRSTSKSQTREICPLSKVKQSSENQIRLYPKCLSSLASDDFFGERMRNFFCKNWAAAKVATKWQPREEIMGVVSCSRSVWRKKLLEWVLSKRLALEKAQYPSFQ